VDDRPRGVVDDNKAVVGVGHMAEGGEDGAARQTDSDWRGHRNQRMGPVMLTCHFLLAPCKLLACASLTSLGRGQTARRAGIGPVSLGG
jgi:hypothetical protein